MTVADLLDIARAAGFPTEQMEQWWKIGDDMKGNRVYIAPTDLEAAVTEIHFSGFTIRGVGALQLSAREAKKRHLGHVQAIVYVNGPLSQTRRAEVLATFQRALQHVTPP